MMTEQSAGDYGATGETVPQYQKVMNDLLSEGMSIGKALAEQGVGYYEEMKGAPKSLYFMSLVGGMGMFVVSAMGLVLRSGLFHSLIQIYLAIFGLVICAVEMKEGYFTSHPEYKSFVGEYFHFILTFYGRAVFYVFCATLLLGQFPYMPDMIAGIYMAGLAGLYIYMGMKSAKKLKDVKLASEDEASALFAKYAADGSLGMEGFTELLKNRGFDFTEQEVDAAIMMIAGETQDTISEEKFLAWHRANIV